MTIDTTQPDQAAAPAESNPYEQLLWPRLASAPDAVLVDLCATIGRRRDQINVAFAGLVFEQFRRRAVELLPIDAEWVRISVDTTGDEPTFVFDAAWDEQLTEFDDDLLDDARENTELAELAAQLEATVVDDYLVFNPTSGACFEGRDGTPAPWCRIDKAMPRELTDTIGMPAWMRQAEQIFGGDTDETVGVVNDDEPVAGW